VTAAVASIAALPAAAAPPRGSSVVTERLAGPGVYDVTVAVVTHPSARHVALTIGSITREATTARRSHRATVRQVVRVSGSSLLIRATASHARASIVAHARRVSGLTARSGGGRTAGAGGAGGTATGATGATGDTAGPAGPTGSPSQPVSGSSGSTGTTGSTPTSGPPGDPSSWNLVFNDDFTSFNSSIWNLSRYDGGGITTGFNSQEEECLDPAQTTVGDGAADLNIVSQSTSCGGETKPYDGSILDTDGKWTFTYGYVEAKVWLPSAGGVIADWPAIWAVGSNWPTGGEIDILEGLDGEACWHFHYGTSGDPQSQGACLAGSSYVGGWHTFGADWEPGSVTWYYDGNDVGTVTTNVTGDPMYLIASLAVDQSYGGPIQAPASLRIDYIRVWQHP